jgi:hypothetical protein
MRTFEMIPYRCRKCSRRFYAYRAGEQSSRMRTPEERKIMELRRQRKWRRSRKDLAIYGGACLVLIVIIYYAIQQNV